MMKRILRNLLLILFFATSVYQGNANGPCPIVEAMVKDYDIPGIQKFLSEDPAAFRKYETLFNTGDFFKTLTRSKTRNGLKAKILTDLDKDQIKLFATDFRNISPQRLAKFAKDPKVVDAWKALEKSPRIRVKDGNLEILSKIRSRSSGDDFFKEVVRLIQESKVKQKLIDNLKKADEVFKVDIQNIKYTAKSSGEVKIVNKHTNELVAIITNGKLEKKKFLTSGQGTPIGDKRYKLFEDGQLVGFAKPASKRGKYGDDFYATVGVEIEKVTNSGLIKKATKWQGQGAYPGVDDWEVYKIKAGTKIYGGLPGQSEFYSTLDNLQDAGFSKVKFWESLQVKPHATHGFRKKVGEYVIKKDIEVAISRTLANKQYGKGGGWQVFVDDFANNLRFTQEIPLLKGLSQDLIPLFKKIPKATLDAILTDSQAVRVLEDILKQFPTTSVQEKYLKFYLKVFVDRGATAFKDFIKLTDDSQVKQKLIDNLVKADEVFKSDIQNITHTAVKSSGEVKIINKHTNELVATIRNGKLEKKKFLLPGQGTPIGDKRYKLFEDGSLVGFAKPASKRGKYGDDFYATVGVEIEKVTNSSGLIKKATKWQGQGAYPGVDDWEVYKIKAGTKIYGGLPGQSEFYSTLDNLQDAGFSKVKFWESLQVKPHATHGFRPKVGEYVIKKDIEVAISRTLANPQYGKGGGWQVFC